MWTLLAPVARTVAKAGRISGWLSVYMLVLDAVGAGWWTAQPVVRLRFVVMAALCYAVLADLSALAQRRWARHTNAVSH